MTPNEELLARLDKEEAHAECEDCWYSCPKSAEGCCNDAAVDQCTCGAELENALRKDAAAEIRRLQGELDAERKALDEDCRTIERWRNRAEAAVEREQNKEQK